ncbi:PREDICTED: AAA-ATPase At3g28540-like [Camelina sativa]|uniref:AAA-ATPase At3g28540-like n=1 Tax=Camelina sativa TaxID=90675 RepID=A0ABM1RM71_CAMSA|nr:PREDICTED: AAA-ATPase At3g28540-like [Camelina sativa]
MPEAGSIWGFAGTTMASLMVFWSMYKQFVPYQIRDYLEKCIYRVIGLVSNSVHIRFTEYTEDKDLTKSQAYDSIRNYLSSKSTARAQRLKANESKNSRPLVLSLDDQEAVEDVFQGVKVVSSLNVWKSYNKSDSTEKRYLTLSFHNRHRDMITTTYLDHVVRVGKEIGLNNRERKLYTNNSSQEWYPWREGRWSNVPFNHPATFETLAMDLEKKDRIKKELWKKRRRKQ